MSTNFDHDRQWFNTLIPPSHEFSAVTVSLTVDYFTLELTREVSTTLYYGRQGRPEGFKMWTHNRWGAERA